MHIFQVFYANRDHILPPHTHHTPNNRLHENIENMVQNVYDKWSDSVRKMLQKNSLQLFANILVLVLMHMGYTYTVRYILYIPMPPLCFNKTLLHAFYNDNVNFIRM